MSESLSVTVSVPATTANIGPGFDCLGAALNLYNKFSFTLIDSGETDLVKIRATGREADQVKTDGSNLAYQSFCYFYKYLGQDVPGVLIDLDLAIPLARGLGSSATAIVGGLVGANCLAGSPLSVLQIGQLATNIEGHPDNVIPALMGGVRLITATGDESQPLVICDLGWHSDLVPIVAIPSFELSTEQARKVLPNHYSRADAIFNMSHLGLLIQALATGNGEWLKLAMADRLHEPYRIGLIPGFREVQLGAIEAGAYGTVISGAGPTILAVADRTVGQKVTEAMSKSWLAVGIVAEAKVLAIAQSGTIINFN